MDNGCENWSEQKMDHSSKYFKINKQTNTMICMKCGKCLCGKRLNNMKRHYQTVHRINIECKRYKEDLSDEELVQSAEPIVEKPSIQNIVNVEVDKNRFLKCCVGLLAIQDLPLELFDDREFFKVLISPFERKYKTDLNSEKMKKILDYCSKKIRGIISRRLKNKLISLKLDMNTQKGANMLVISAQFMMLDFKIHTNSLGVIQLQKQSSASQLKEEILRCLSSYRFDLSQIYAITTGDGMNSIKTHQLMREFQDQFALVRQIKAEISSGDESLQEAQYSQEVFVPILIDLRCAAHLIQLAANDVLGTLELGLNDCRNVVRKVHDYLENYEHELEAPVLDDNKSWISTYEMLKSLLKIKDFIASKLFASHKGDYDLNWEFVDDIQASFEPLANCFNKLFDGQYIIGDFYRDWLECELELEELAATKTYASHLQQAMEHSKAMLLQNDAFLAALYLDPRFNFQKSTMLTEDQKSAALTHLLKIYDVMSKLQLFKQQAASAPVNPMDTADVDEEIPSTSGQSSYSRLEQRMNAMMTASLVASNVASKCDFKQKLILLTKNSYKVPLSTDVLHYWKNSTFDDDVRNLAQVILAVPVTQMSAESPSSSVASIIGRLKSKLSTQTLESLILTKLNFKLINSVTTKLELALESD